MTDAELLIEFHYRYEERLAILCGGSEPTQEQKALAFDEADKACNQLKP